jgi:hypothetical protein
MFSDLFFFYNTSCSEEDIRNQLKKYSKPFKIITNRSGLLLYLKNLGEDIEMIDKSVPSFGDIGKEINKDSKNKINEYDKIFEKILYNDIQIYEGFRYKLLVMLEMHTKIKKILQKKENVIFIFEGYNPVYLSIKEELENNKILEKFEVNQIIGNKIKKIVNEKNDYQKTQQNFSFQRAQNFLKISMAEKTNKEKITKSILFLKQITSLIIKKSVLNLTLKNNKEIKILEKVDKKIEKISKKQLPEYAFFVTTSREDLHIKPWESIFEKMEKEGRNFQIFTSDISTNMVLENKKFPFCNLFEEINILTKYIQSSSHSHKFKNEITEIQNSKEFVGSEAILNDLIQRVYRSVAITIVIYHIFSKLNLKSIMLGADGEMLENISAAIASKFSIPSYSMLSVEINPVYPVFSEWFHAEKIFLNGEHSKILLKSLNYSENRLCVFGNPKFDKFKKMDLKKNKEKLFEQFKIDKRKKLIIIAMSQWRDNDELWLSKLIKFCNKNNFEIIIKIHPKYNSTGSNEASETKIARIKKECKKEKFLISYNIDLYSILSASDLLITDYSMTGIEALIFEKPVLSVNFNKEYVTDSPIKIAIEEKAILYTEKYDEIEEIIFDIFNNDQKSIELNHSRKKIIEQYNKFNDGKATERIFDLVVKDILN